MKILFRGQTRKYGEKINMRGKKLPGNWVYGGIFPNNDGGDFAIIYTQKPVGRYVVYADTVGQYTGLPDKNGIDIFTDDIVRKPLPVSGMYSYGVITLDKGSYWMSCGTDGRTLLGTLNDKIEVVGNIHDNPELMPDLYKGTVTIPET